MQRKYFYLVRHGESLGNLGFNVGCDPSLSPKGRTQAAFCAEFLHKECLGTALIFSSPFLRCLQTAHAISEKIAGGIRLEPLLHEFYSKELFPEEAKFSPLKEIASSNRNIVGTYDGSTWMPDKYESKENLLIRAAILRNSMLSGEQTMSGECSRIILVAHFASIVAMAEVMLGIKMQTVSNCSVTKISFADGEFLVEYMNNTSFIINNQI